jgi:hypothetical protein
VLDPPKPELNPPLASEPPSEPPSGPGTPRLFTDFSESESQFGSLTGLIRPEIGLIRPGWLEVSALVGLIRPG